MVKQPLISPADWPGPLSNSDTCWRQLDWKLSQRTKPSLWAYKNGNPGLFEAPRTCSQGFLNPRHMHVHARAHTYTHTSDSLNEEISLVLICLFFSPLSKHFLPKMMRAGLYLSWQIQDSHQREPSFTPTTTLLWADTYMQLPIRQVCMSVIQQNLCSAWEEYRENAKRKWLILHSTPLLKGGD